MIKKIFAWGVVFLLLGGMVHSAAASDAQIVKSIEFKGLKRIKPKRVERFITQRIGKPLSEYRVRRDFLKLYNSRLFSNLELLSDRVEGGIKLTYVLTERPVVEDIEFSGLKKLKDVKITTYLNDNLERDERIRKGKALASYKLEKYIQLIKKYCAREGFYLAEVSVVLKETEPGYVIVRFNIKEKKIVRIKWIEFFGNKAYKDWRLRWVISTSKFYFPFNLGRYEEEKFQEDLKKLKDFYHKRGFLSMRISDYRVNVNKKLNRIYIEITIDEGPRYRYGGIELFGNKLFTTEQIVYWLNLKEGKRYKQKKVDEATQFIRDKYGELGYISSYVNIEPLLDPERKRADLRVTIDEGSKYYIERIDFEGNDVTKEKVLRREMLLKPTETANTKKLRLSYEKLNRLGYFKELEPQVVGGSRNDLVNIVWRLKEQKTGRFTVGASYSNRDKLTGQLGLGIVNLMGYGQKVNASVEVGEKLLYYSFTFTEPYVFDTHNYFSVSYENTRREVLGYNNLLNNSDRVGYSVHKQGGSVKLGHPFWDYLWVFVKHGVVSSEYSKITDIRLPSGTNEGVQVTRTLGATLNWDNRDDTFFPVRGNYQFLGFTQAGGFLKGENNFIKLKFDSRWYYGFYREKLALATRFSGDYVKEFGPSKTVPAEERFELGGSTTVRGYPDFGLGFQKRYRLFNNSEFRWKLNKAFQLITFWDAGGIWDYQVDIKTSDFYPGAGVGFRVQVPMLGIVRIDYGVPLDPRWPVAKESGQVHFNVGTTF